MQQNQSKGNHGNPTGVKSYPTLKYSAGGVQQSGQSNATSTLRAAKNEAAIVKAHRKLRLKSPAPSSAKCISRQAPPLLPTYSSQSFRSRRRAANLLAALAAVFVFCWLPYVICAFWEIFANEES